MNETTSKGEQRNDLDLRTLCLCDGYGGFELGLRSVGVPVRTVARVERDSYAAAVLVARMEEQALDQCPIWDDLTTFDGGAWRGRVDCVTAGFPCQPFSSAGQQRGTDDDRWLWPAIGRIIRDLGPRYVFLENVPGLVRGGLPHVLTDLADLGFDAEWGLLSAADIGAPHKRQRFWLLAVQVGDAGSSGRPEVTRSTHEDESEHAWRCTQHPNIAHCSVEDVAAAAHDQYPPTPDDYNGWGRWLSDDGPEPSVRRSTDGGPVGLADALHLGGNGLVPLAAGTAFLALKERLTW